MRHYPLPAIHSPLAGLIVALCVPTVWQAADDASGAYTLSRGRQIVLSRGLQIQGEVIFPSTPTSTQISQWTNSNFTALWFAHPVSDSPLTLPVMPAGTLWAQMYGRDYDSRSNRLQPNQLPYLNSLTAFQYEDEGGSDPANPTILADMTANFRYWNDNYQNALAYANFGPLQTAFSEAAALASYAQTAKPDMLCFDYYPSDWVGNPLADQIHIDDRNTWYSTMQRFRTVALAGYTTNGSANSGPIACGQYLNLHRDTYSSPLYPEAYIRLEQNASWAFGYSFLAGYHYNDMQWGPNDVPMLFDASGAPTEAYDYVKEGNRQSRNLSPSLARMVSTDIRMIPGSYGRKWSGGKWVDKPLPLPDGISVWSTGTKGGYADYITGITALGQDGGVSHVHSDVLVGYFAPLLSNNSNCTFVDGLHFMIVNGGTGDGTVMAASDLAEKYYITFDFLSSGFNSLVRLDRNTGTVKLVTLTHVSDSQFSYELWLDGGTCDLFGFWNSANPLPTIPEPGTFVLATITLIGLLAYAWWRRRDIGWRR